MMEGHQAGVQEALPQVGPKRMESNELDPRARWEVHPHLNSRRPNTASLLSL